MNKGLRQRLLLAVTSTTVLAFAAANALAVEPFKTRAGEARYIVQLDDPTLVERMLNMEQDGLLKVTWAERKERCCAIPAASSWSIRTRHVNSCRS